MTMEHSLGRGELTLAASASVTGVAAVLALSLGAGPDAWAHVVGAFAYLGTGLLGVVLLRRRPGNAAGVVLVAACAGAAVTALLAALVGTVSLTTVGVAVLTVLGTLAAASMFALLSLGVLLFPSGRPQTRLGHGLVVAGCVSLMMIVVGSLTNPDWVLPGTSHRLPWKVGGWTEPLGIAGLVLFVVVSVLAPVDVDLRRRRATDELRRGLALLEGAAVLSALVSVASGAVGSSGVMPGWFGPVFDQTGLLLALAAWVALPMREELETLLNLAFYGERADPVRQLAELRAQAQRDAQRLMVAARDEERRRIRRDLHDGLGPTLSGIVLGIEGAERHQGDPERLRRDLATLREVSRSTVEEVRRIVYALRPPALDALGLDGAIRAHAEQLGAARVDLAPLPELPETVEIGVYLLALEAMKNAATHARPGRFWVRLGANERLRLEVADDGPGLPDTYQPGLGIGSMRSRAAELGGTLTLSARRPTGTLVSAEWPLP